MSTYLPDSWLVSLQRALKDYVMSHVDNFIVAGSDPSGLEIYDVVFDWPESDDPAVKAGFSKTIIHFIIDDIDNLRLGIGDSAMAAVETAGTGGNPDTISYREAQMHMVNFDVGIWASDKSGGSTARLVAYEMLQKILSTEIGRKEIRAATGGIEVVRFTGGRFITDNISDVRVFRTIDSELVTRVFSRFVGDDLVIVDREPEVTPSLTIDHTPIS